ncbi:DUF2628 domain-containing protein [Rhizobium terrae]|uniref:DUF2628 domain-containing protein n=1 Tax=Rhizobium terrae TaxID=2171756 RepID=UPI000E3E3206|nr:DUF2628 domain-containing protein [Rhizobium terrae]
MRSYLVLTPPDHPQRVPDRDHHSTLVLQDGFSWTALIFPWIWLLWNRLWLPAAIVFLLQILSGLLMTMPEFELAGGLLGLAVSLIVALEGRHYRSETLIRRGWTLEKVVAAPDLDVAEEIYFSSLPEPEKQPMPVSAEWAKQGKPAAGWQGPQMGLFEHGGR